MDTGGSRPRTGSIGVLEKRVQRAEKTVAELQAQMTKGLKKIAIKYDLLIEEELRTAMEDEDGRLRMQARHYLMDILHKSVPVKPETTNNVIVNLFQKWGKEEDVATEGEGRIIDVEYKAVEGAE